MIRAMLIIGGAALIVGLTLYTLLDAVRTPAHEARTLPKWLWVLVTLLFPVVGPLMWLILGRPSEKGAAEQPPAADTGRGLKGRRGAVPPAPKAPDDDEEYLRWLKAKAERERRSREAESNNKQDPEDNTPGQSSGQN